MVGHTPGAYSSRPNERKTRVALGIQTAAEEIRYESYEHA